MHCVKNGPIPALDNIKILLESNSGLFSISLIIFKINVIKSFLYTRFSFIALDLKSTIFIDGSFGIHTI